MMSQDDAVQTPEPLQGFPKVRNPAGLTGWVGEATDFSYLAPPLGMRGKECPLQGFGRGYSVLDTWKQTHSQTSKATGYSDCLAGVDRCDVMFQIQFLALCTSLLTFPSLDLGFHS